jgi:hypothetical protein
MISSVRTIVDLPQEQIGALARLCEAQQISRAEAVRRAVSRLLEESAAGRKDVGFGLGKRKRVSSRRFVGKMWSEWGIR